jgi:hypothetical protein
MSHPAGPRRTVLVRIEDGLWAIWPGRIWPRAPTLGLLFADGGWMRARPGLGLAVPVVALLLGAWRGGWRPTEQLTYGYSLGWMCVLLAVALAGCGVAVWLWLGFVLGDLLIFDHPPLRFFGEPSLWDQLRFFLVPHLVSYLLLAALLVGGPLIALLARGSVAGLLSAAPSRVRAGFGAAAAMLAAGTHAALWTQAYPLLIRPLWTWGGLIRTPAADGIRPIQDHPLLLGLVAGVAAAVWAWASFAALEQISGRRYQPVARAQPRRPVGPAWPVASSLLRAAVTTLLLSGLIPALWHGLVAFAILFAAFLAQTLLLPRTTVAGWWTARLPSGIRLLAAATLAWLVAWQIGRTAYQTSFGVSFVTAQNFAPLLYATVAAIACMALLLPAVRDGTSAAARGGPADTAGGPGTAEGTP